ncbi:MAG: hypothetical protein GXO43_05735 [Crenarchaeota archaeon]|nr:hypothetical protein [Thermoproteota archaeon]
MEVITAQDYLRYYAKRGVEIITDRLRRIRPDVIAIKEFYCDLVNLEKADAFDLSEFMTDECRELVENLMKAFGLRCEETPY